MAYPSVISTLVNPQPTDRLNSPSHSSLHQSENTAVIETQTFLGTLSSLQGTISYDVRSSNSNGGGHIQTANKGGTGQTSFNKGDLLIAQSSSVITKLSVGADAQALVADSSQAVGIKWATPGGTKLGVSGARSSIVAVVAETSVMSVSVPASTLGTGNAIRSNVFLPYVSMNTASNIDVRVSWGNASIAFFHNVGAAGANQSFFGRIETELLATSSSTQTAITTLTFNHPTNVPQTASVLAQGMLIMNSLIDGGAIQTLGATISTGGSSGDRVDVGGYIVERIV